MPVHLRRSSTAPAWLAAAAALVLAACSASGAGPLTDPLPPDGAPTSVDPPSAADPAPDPTTVPHEVVLVADLGPLADGSGRAVVTTTWTTGADGAVRLAVDTPAGLAEQHVWTAEEHWWWLHPHVRRAIADAEWLHFDLSAVAAAGGRLPAVVADARRPPPRPRDLTVGDVVAGREVLGVEVVDDDEVLLTVVGIEQPVVHRRRPLPPDTRIGPPAGAVDVADLPDVLGW